MTVNKLPSNPDFYLRGIVIICATIICIVLILTGKEIPAVLLTFIVGLFNYILGVVTDVHKDE